MRVKFLQVLYGFTFVILVPVGLVFWAYETRTAVDIVPLHSTAVGAGLVVIGVIAISMGMLSLWHDGGGLPMNAFPPPRLVERGVYSLVPHPIYGGFVLLCAGVSVWSGSASGLWLVTPSVALGCAALVLGYELPDLSQRFGVPARSCWLPAGGDGPPSLIERVRVYLVVLLPWLAFYELFGVLGKPVWAIGTYFLPIERHWPVIEQTETLYASTYLVIVLAPVLLRSGRALRQFALHGLTAIAIIFPLYLLLPFYVPPRPYQHATLLAPLLEWERTPYSGIAAFPSFHVVWACIAASSLGGSGRLRKWLWWAWAALVAFSCITTGMHSIADVAAGLVAYFVVVNAGRIWETTLRWAEQIANSWREWRFGPVRVINHGGYVAAAAFVGVVLIDTLLGPSFSLVTVSVFLCSITGAVLWAQVIEGSPVLLRPMGFYGGLLGAMIGAVPALFLGASLWTVLAATCIAAPWIQAIGRLRCLVQGCCHGRPVETEIGIRYTHPRSRVCQLANLAGVPVHATPVYSILWNIVVGAALLRFLSAHVSCTMICGVYLLLSGAGRFVEEAYRGEPQTKIVYGLRIYQWIAVLGFVFGAALTAIPTQATLPPPMMHWSSLALGLVCGAVGWLVSGVDFPESSRRFARLT